MADAQEGASAPETERDDKNSKMPHCSSLLRSNLSLSPGTREGGAAVLRVLLRLLLALWSFPLWDSGVWGLLPGYDSPLSNSWSVR